MFSFLEFTCHSIHPYSNTKSFREGFWVAYNQDAAALLNSWDNGRKIDNPHLPNTFAEFDFRCGYGAAVGERKNDAARMARFAKPAKPASIS